MSEARIRQCILFLIGATFFVPLIVGPNSFIFPFIVPKIVVFRSLALLIFGGYLLLLSSNAKKYNVLMSPVTVVILLYLVSMGISTFVGVDWYRSFWDNHERMLGLFTIVHYVLFYIVTVAVAKKDWHIWKQLSRVFLLAGGIVMILAIVQKIHPEFLLNRGSSRVSATLGNAIYLGGYGMFVAFLSAILFFKSTAQKWRSVYAIVGILGVIGIFASGTRGVFLGFLSGLFLLAVYYAFIIRHNKRWVRKAFVVFLLVGIATVGIVYTYRHTPIIKNTPVIGRLVKTTLSGGTASTRLMAWGIAIEGWQERPVFGWGPNNYYFAFNKYYRPEFLRHGYGETWFDNAHNATMNTFTTQGLVGVILYLSLFAVPLVLLYRRVRAGTVNTHVAAIGSAFLVSHFVSQLFVFENATSYIYLFFMLAFLNNMITREDEHSDQGGSQEKVGWGTTSIVGVVVLLLVFSTNINPARANMATLDALRATFAGQKPIEALDAAVRIPSPHIDDIRNDFARTVAQGAPQYAKAGNTELAKQLVERAYSELEKNRVLHPGDIRVHMQQTQLAQIAAEISQDPALIVKAEKILEEAISYSPKRQQLYYTLSGLQMQLGKGDDALETLKTAISFDNTIKEGWYRTVLIYNHMGRVEDAKNAAQEALDLGIRFNSTQKKLVDTLLGAEGEGKEKNE